MGLAGCWPTVAARSRLASGIATLLVLNAAAWVGFWVWMSGSAARSWGKVSYDRVVSPIREDLTVSR